MWMGQRHSRLIQWLVLFAVVQPGQHCPPQTFLLWGQQNRVSTRVLREILFREPLGTVPPSMGEATGNTAMLARPALGRPCGPWDKNFAIPQISH